MTAAPSLTAGGRDIALELHGMLRELDPARWRAEARAATAERLTGLAQRTQALLESTRAARDGKAAELRARLAAMRVSLEAQAAELRGGVDGWRARHKTLQQHYEAVASSLRDHRVHVPSLRPTNYARNLFHVVWGCVALSMIQWLLSPTALMWAAGGFTAYAWSLELIRRRSPAFNARVMALYGKVAHPHEWNQVNSATWYATALLGLSLTQSTMLCLVPVAVLTFADPAAALIGRRFGRIRLVHGRSLEGTTTFFIVGSIAAFCAAAFGQGVPTVAAVAIAAGAAAFGALAELFSQRVDDNLTVPLAAMVGAVVAASLVGLPL